jgi:hypothetical protein
MKRTGSGTGGDHVASRGFVSRRSIAGIVAVAFALEGAGAQGRIPRTTGVALEPTFFSWSFATPLDHDSARVKSLSQIALPFSVVVPLGDRWTLDASGAYTTGTVKLEDESGNDAGSLDLNGPTDVKLRVVGRVAGDAVLLTLGVNAPTGLTKLDETEVVALRAIGAPVLHMPAPTLGSGFGASAGVVFAREVGSWALAFGTSYELRSSYTALEAEIAGGAATTDLDPSDVTHVSLGADRLVGAHRLSLLATGDVFGDATLRLQSGGGEAEGTYKLGPAISFLALLELGVPGLRELSFAIIDRYRSSYRGLDGATASGSSGNAIEFMGRLRTGGPGRIGFVVGADAWMDTGLEVDNSIATAATTAAGLLVGVSIPTGSYALEPFVRANFGNVDTGPRSSSVSGLGFGVMLRR